jgi:hypothetical protein
MGAGGRHNPSYAPAFCDLKLNLQEPRLRNCPQSFGGAHCVALRTTETVLLARISHLGPFWPPYTGQIHAQSAYSYHFSRVSFPDLRRSRHQQMRLPQEIGYRGAHNTGANREA